MADTPPPPEAPPAVPRIIVLGTSLLVLANLLGTIFLINKSFHPPVVVAAHEAEGANNGAEGPIVPLDGFVVNLKEPTNDRYLKVAFALQVLDANVQTKVGNLKEPVKAELISYLSGLSVADTVGEKAKIDITNGIEARLEKLFGKGRIQKVFITEFVVQ